ncbi:MAG TPA: cytochrome P450 [Halioglobus sp.]
MKQAATDHRNFPDASIKSLKHIPGKIGAPFLGMTPWLFRDFYGTLKKHHQKFGLVSKIGIGFQKGVLVLGPQNFQEILLDTEQNFSSQIGYRDTVFEWFGGAILARDFDEHRLHRRVFQTAFKSDAMQGYSEGINSIISDSLKNWEKREEIVFMPFIKELLMNIGARIFYGINALGEDAARFSEAFNLILEKGMLSLIKKDIPPLNYHYGQKGRRFVYQYLDSLIEDRRKNDGRDFMSYLVKSTRDDGSYFSNKELIDHLSFLFFAAYDTTSAGLSHLLMHLAADPALQETLREQSLRMDKDEVTVADIEQLTGIEMAFNEALRLYPPVSIFMRRSIRDCRLGGINVPAHTALFMVPGFNHRMPEFWSNPDTFDPGRFSEARQEHRRHKFQYVPFGGGAHKCIGMNFALMNAKLFMHQLLRRYRVTLRHGYTIGSQILPTPCPLQGLPLLIEKL